MIRKIVLAITSLAVTAGVVVNPLPAAAEEKSSEPWILSMMHSVDYEDKSIGDTIYKGSYYNMTVQADPSDPSNKCSKEVATEHDTQGFGPTYDINPAVTSETPFIIEEDVMFSTQQWMEYQMYLRCVDGENGHGYGINLWSINTWDIFGITPEQNKWYKIIFMIDGPRSQYTVYIKDSKDNYLFQKRDIPLPDWLDYSMGFKLAYTRYQGTINTDATAYVDNLRIYTIDRDLFERKIEADYKAAEKRVKFYSDEARERLQNAIVLFINGPYAFVNNKKMLIDNDNPVTSPVIINDRTLIPVRFVSESFGAEVDWNQASRDVNVKLGDTNVRMVINNRKMQVNGEEVILDVPPTIINDRTFIPVRALAETLGKNVFWDSRGLVVISDRENIFDSETEQDMIAELAMAKYAVKKPEMKIADESLLTEGVAERKASFAERDSDENIKNIALELQTMLDCSREELAAFNQLMDAGRYREALAAYEKFFMDTTKGFSDDYFTTSFLYPQLQDMARTKVTDIKADMLLYNVITANNKSVSVGEPGVVNWEYEKPEKKFDSSYFLMQRPFMWEYTTFDPLLYTYMATDNISYMLKWNEYTDDYCMNQNLYSDMMPYDVPDNLNGSPQTRDYLYRMKTLSTYLNGRYDLYSETSFTRLLLKILDDYPVHAVIYTRNNPQNWTNDQYNDLMMTGLMLDKLCFKMGKDLYRIGKRRCESFVTIAFVPDGTDIEQVVAYDIVGLRGLGWIMDSMSKVAPGMLTDKWLNEYTDYAIDRGTFLTHFITPQGNFPQGFRSDTRLRLYTIDEMRRYSSKIYDVNENETVAEKLLEFENAKDPSFTSEAYPYGGFYIFRDGWKHTSQNAMLYGHSHNVITNMGKNVFVLNAFDQDMIGAGEVGMYDHVVTQNFVDGVPQNDNAGIPTWGHKGLRISAWDVPNENRWSSTDSYDYAESEYHGPYGTGLVPKDEIEKYGGRQNIADLDSQVLAGKNVIEGITHQRQVNFVKSHGLWIVTDRLSSEDEHDYTTRWTLPIEEVVPRIKWSYRAYNKENIELDEKECCLRTQDEGMPNISLYNFSTSPISYKTSTLEVPEWNGEKTSDFYYLDTSFKGKDEILVTAFYPRKTQSNEVVSMTKLGKNGKTAGFKAVLEDGATVQYLTSVNKEETLKFDEAAIQGEALLLTKEITGEMSGVALGCKKLAVNGVTQEPPCSDFEFKIIDGVLCDVVEINTPVMPVEIEPGIDTFYDTIDVTMSCKTENVDIRYTTDGSDPTPDSALYTGPVTLKESTVLKGRAFRKGVTEDPVTMSCDKASVTTYSEFNKEELRQPKDTGELEQGLDYDYYEGDWKKEYMSLNDCVPISHGKVSSMLDISQKQTENGAFAFRYKGYIEAPEDGIYTFWAPDEYNRSECMAGYELNVYIDGEQWYPATRRFGFGGWSIPLAKGKHRIEVGYSDFRMDAVKEYNREGLKKQLIWDGVTPELMISGPGIEKQLIPDSMLYRDK